MLEINDLHASIGDRQILKGISLSVAAGEVHAIMGPNGSGKSTLAQVLAGHPGYEVTGGSATYDGQDLLALPPEERAQKGIFLAFQYPVEIPGVTNAYFLRAAYNEIRKSKGQDEIDPMDFRDLVEERLRLVDMDPAMLSRAVIDALRVVAHGVNSLRRPDNATIVVTHYQRLLNYIVPDQVHVLAAGRIVKSGGKDLALELEAKGYDWLVDAAPASASASASANVAGAGV
jgi:Fe-S cluster assembly ATP-binding protein